MSLPDRVMALTLIAPGGFAMAFHVNFTRPAFLIQNYPAEWTQIYSARGYVMTDPTVKWGFENAGTIRWSDLGAPAADGVLAEAARHGLTFGLTHVTDIGGTRSMTSFARPDREFEGAEVAEIERHVDAIHMATQGLGAMTAADLAAVKRITLAVTQP